jgi:hypothetical protein
MHPVFFTQYGGIDQYVLNTKSDLLGWEGMRLRIAVREAQERKALEAFPSTSGAHTHGMSPIRPIALVALSSPLQLPRKYSISFAISQSFTPFWHFHLSVGARIVPYRRGRTYNWIKKRAHEKHTKELRRLYQRRRRELPSGNPCPPSPPAGSRGHPTASFRRLLVSCLS